MISENSQGLQGLKFHVSINSSRASHTNSLMCFAPPAADYLPKVSITRRAGSAGATARAFLLFRTGVPVSNHTNPGLPAILGSCQPWHTLD